MCYLNFATRASNRHERSRQWERVTETWLAELDDDQEASIRRCNLGDLRLCAVSLGRHRLENGWRSVPVEADGRVKFIFQEEGTCIIEQGGHEATISAGQWYAIDKTLPFSSHASGVSRQIAMSLPRRRIARWQGVTGRLVQPLGFLRGAGQVLHSSATAAMSAGAVLGRGDRARLGDALVTLLNVAWHAEPLTERPGPRSRRMAVLDYIERNLADPNLDVAAIACALGFSKRTLHQIFADDVVTVGRIIWERRLERCRRELADPACMGESITEIAHRWGFSDSQHFSRSFKARFNVSPRTYRQSQLSN
ncbi:MAG TPA: helix-turn-helix domain-containing protein [Sphingobium sp.]|nr:helix-turn-helix domain-containing protein [Sphingobium sp.]